MFSSDIFGYIDGAFTPAYRNDRLWILKDKSINTMKCGTLPSVAFLVLNATSCEPMFNVNHLPPLVLEAESASTPPEYRRCLTTQKARTI
jgi:hypothetical protein